MRTVWGFGVFQVGTDSTNFASFPNTQGQIRFIEEFNEYTTISGSYRRISKGWRPEISVNIYNVCADDWQDVVEMFDHINQTKALNLPLWVQPRYDTDADADVLAYNCELISDVALEDIASTEVGQSISLQFRGRERITSLPTNTSNPQTDEWVDELGNQYVDESANTYQLKS